MDSVVEQGCDDFDIGVLLSDFQRLSKACQLCESQITSHFNLSSNIADCTYMLFSSLLTFIEWYKCTRPVKASLHAVFLLLLS